jgi:hypothetical protein
MASSGRWAAVPVSIQLDPRALQLTAEAELFHFRAWLYSGEHGTDGVVPTSALPLLTMKLIQTAEELLEQLLSAGLCRRKRDEVVLVDYLAWNPSAALVRKKSEHGRKAAIARWAGQKQPPGDDSTDQDPDHDSDTDDASGIPTGNASGIADGNTQDGTGRDGTNPKDLDVDRGECLASEDDEVNSFDGGPLTTVSQSSSPPFGNWEDDKAQQAEVERQIGLLDSHFSASGAA